MDRVAKVTHNASNFLDFHLTMLKRDDFVSVFIFTAFEIKKIIEIFRVKAIFMNFCDFDF